MLFISLQSLLLQQNKLYVVVFCALLIIMGIALYLLYIQRKKHSSPSLPNTDIQ